MAVAQNPILVLDEISDFLASLPTREQFLKFRPSKRMQQRVSELLLKQNEGDLTRDEKNELDQFAQADILMRLVKAKLLARKKART